MRYLEIDELVDGELYVVINYDGLIFSAKYRFDQFEVQVENVIILIDFDDIRYVISSLSDHMELIRCQ